MADGLLSGVLPFIYSQGDRLKNRLSQVLSDPVGVAQQYIGNLNDDAGRGLGLLAASGSPVAPPTADAQTARNALIDALGPAMMGATVWHGSPHVFDAFDASKIGTGEGAQAYGHGLYLSEAPDVATQYRSSLAGDEFFVGGQKVGAVGDLKTPRANAARLLDVADGDVQKAMDHVDQYASSSPYLKRIYGGKAGDEIKRQIQDVATAGVERRPGGALYQVDLPDEVIAKMLDWDKPVMDQPHVVDALSRHPDAAYFTGFKSDPQVWPDKSDWQTGRALYGQLNSVLGNGGDSPFRTMGDGIAAAQALRNLGIPGIKYLDGGSRGAGAGTSNYVVFPGNESLLQIIERNGLPMQRK